MGVRVGDDLPIGDECTIDLFGCYSDEGTGGPAGNESIATPQIVREGSWAVELKRHESQE